MLNVFYSSEIIRLADKLIEIRRQKNTRNPLEPEVLVVPNHDMGQWLSLYMAENVGVTANLQFEFPSERIWKLIRLLHDDIPETLPSDRGPLTWSVFKILQDLGPRSNFEQLQYYIRDEDAGQQTMRAWKLSAKIADVFDQYLIYRPDLLLGWQKGNLQFFSNTEKWQASLWRRLMKGWKKKYSQKYIHRAQLQFDLLDTIEKGEVNTQKLPEVITIFGVSQLPQVFTDILLKVSDIVDVRFLQLATALSSDYKNNNKNAQSSHSLLEQLGKQETEFYHHFKVSLENCPQLAVSEVHLKAKKAAYETTFQHVRDDLVQIHISSDARISDDDSIQLHSCHSCMREIEVLYDQLLNIFDKHSDVDPADVLIISPDLGDYATLIEAVFGEPDEGQPAIPFHFSDRKSTEHNLAIKTFLKVLDLFRSRFKMTDVLDIISTEPIRKVFSFSNEDLNHLEKWIGDNRIRWGINGVFKSDKGIAKSDHYTWQAGLNHMLLGFAMQADEEKPLYKGISPYDEIETSEDASLLGGFSNFLNTLFAFQKRSNTLQRPAYWADILLELSESLLPDSVDYAREISQIRKTLAQLKDHAALAEYNQKVPFRLIFNIIKNQLEEFGSQGSRWGQGVTFARMVPVQGIPYKMIGMIGMNEEAFPRSQVPIEFDLMEQESRAGDPVKREEDRYLFLKMILSAKQFLYLSYEGQSNREDADFPPSVVIKNFINYISEKYDIEEDSLVTKHFLQAHSPSYFKDHHLISYSKNQKKLSRLLSNKSTPKPFLQHDLPAPDAEFKTISLTQLISFFSHPSKFFCRQRLGVYLEDTETLTEDREPFELQGLDKYEVGQRLINRYLKGEDLEHYDKVLSAQDLLPEGWGGQEAYQKKVTRVKSFGAQLGKLLDQPKLDDYEFDYSFKGFRLRGHLTGLYKDHLLQYRFGKERPKDLIKLWISHLVVQQCEAKQYPSESLLATQNDDESWVLTELQPPEQSAELLEELIKIYWKGMQGRCYFFPRSSYAYAKELFTKDNGTAEKALDKAAYQWKNERRSYGNEGEDPYNKLVMGAKDPFSQRFQTVSATVWKPFFETLRNGEM